MTDVIADMLTRIRNALSAKHETVEIPASNTKKAIADILLREGYIVAIASDASLGAAAAPVHVSGDSLLMSAEGPLILPATRTIELADKARFVLRSASEG